MARLESKILPILQDYQSALLLDYLIEFRDTFISRIVSRWLRAELMAGMEGYCEKPLEQRLKHYFGDMTGLANEYSGWYKKLAGREIETDRKEEFSALVSELRSTLAIAKHECLKVVSYFPSAGDTLIETDAAQIDRRCEKSPATRRIGLAIDHYMRSKEFRDLLRSPPENKSGFGLIALFSIVPFKVDYPDDDEPLQKDGYEWKPGGVFRVLLPKEIVEDAEQVREFLPLLGSNRAELENFHRLTEKMSEQASFALREWEDAHTKECCQPVKYLGTNCFVYTTGANKCIVAQQYAETCIITRNVNFVQLVPNPQKMIRGFFQLQSPLPGLVRTLFPYYEFPKDWNHLVANGDTVGLGGTEMTESAVVIEMPRSRVKWLTNWIEKGSAETPTEAIPPYCLELIFWIRHSVTPWSENFYKQLNNLDEMSSKLSEKITPLINEKYRQMLELLATPLGNLSNALGEMQRDAQELRAVLYDPSKALFHSAPLLANLFQEAAEIDVSQHLRVMVSHSVVKYKSDNNHDEEKPPAERRETAVNGQVILSVALCRIFGCVDVLSSAKRSQWAIDSALEELKKRTKMAAFRDLDRDLSWLLNRRIENNKERHYLDDLGRNADPSNSLDKLKQALFDPFKLSAKTWNVEVFSLAVLPYVEEKTRTSLPRMGGLPDMNPEWSPIVVHTALAFVVDISAEAFARKTKIYVKSIELKGNGGIGAKAATEFEIICQFTGLYLDSAFPNGWQELKNLVHDHVLQKATRDWRITESQAGNFTKPYVDLASRLLGFGTEWKVADVASKPEILFRVQSTGNRSFSISLDQSDFSKATAVKLSWKPVQAT